MAKEAGADLVKIDGAADFPEAVSAVARAGVPVWAQFGITPQTALRHGVGYQAMLAARRTGAAGHEGRRSSPRRSGWRRPGLPCSTSPTPGPSAGPSGHQAVAIPVIGGAGGGPWLDGRVRMAHAAIGYAARTLDEKPDSYAHVAQVTLDTLSALTEDVRARPPHQGRRRGAGDRRRSK